MYTTTNDMTAMRDDLHAIAEHLATVIARLDRALAAPPSPFDADGVATDPTPAPA